jgi:small subunit ribosomal protein S14
MKYLFVKNSKQRLHFKDFEIQEKVLKSLTRNNLLAANIRQKFLWQLEKLCVRISFVRIKNYCISSGKARSVYTFFNLSRSVIKVFHTLQYIPALSRSS